MKLAVCLWEFDPTLEFAEALASDSVECVEPGYPFLTAGTPKDVAEGIDTLRSAGVEVRSAHAPFGDNADLSIADENARSAAVETHFAAVDRAVEAGINALVVHPDSRYDLSEEKEIVLSRALKSIEAVAAYSEKLDGPILAVENMPPGHPLAGFDTTLKIAEKLESPKVGICLDTGHAFLNDEKLDDNIRRAGAKLANIHMHDNDGAWDKHIQPPYGAHDWRPFAKELRSSTIKWPISIEALPFANGSRNDMLREVAALLDGRIFSLERGGKTFTCRCPECSAVVLMGSNGNLECRCRP